MRQPHFRPAAPAAWAESIEREDGWWFRRHHRACFLRVRGPMSYAAPVNKYFRLLGFLLLAVILWQADLGAMGAVLRDVHLEIALAALGVNLVAIAVKAARWNLMLRAQRLHYPFLRALLVYFAGIYIGVATPGRLGELSRVLYLKRDLGISAGTGLSSVVVDRLLDLYALIIVGLAACFQFDVAGRSSPAFLALVGAMAVAPLMLLNPRFGRWFARRVVGWAARRKLGRHLADGAEDFFAGLEQLISPRLVIGIVLTALAYLGVFYSGFLAARALEIPVDYLDAGLTVGLANLLALIPITVAGVGTREAVFILAFGALGLAEAQALGYSALVLAVFYLGVGLFGLACFAAYRPPADAAS